MFKHGEPGWRIEFKPSCSAKQWAEASDLMWFWGDYNYRAVRIEKVVTRTPLPIEHYRRGMEVRIQGCCLDFLVSRTEAMNLILENGWVGDICNITHWRWPNESEWYPAYTETVQEKEVERLEVEG